jgi:glycosyltransferase involved in cell wall biosynthesis
MTALGCFSIIIPTLNEEEHIEKLVRSIHEQDFRPIEVIVVDDGSKDGTIKIVTNLAKELDAFNFVVVLLETQNFGRSRGPAVAKNIGIKKSSGEFIYLADADFLLIQKNFLTKVRRRLLEAPVAPFRSRVLVDNSLEMNQLIDGGNPPYHGISYAFRRCVFDKVIFDSNLGVGEDTDLVAKLRKQGFVADGDMLSDVEVALHYPHSLAEYGTQKFWHGKNVPSMIKNQKNIRTRINLLARLAPVVLICIIPVFFFTNILVSMVALSILIASVLYLFAKSPTKSVNRLAYLFLRMTYGSLWFAFGFLKGLYDRIRGIYCPGRES